LAGTANDGSDRHRPGRMGSMRNIGALLGVMMLLAAIGGAFASDRSGQAVETKNALAKELGSGIAGPRQDIQLVRFAGASTLTFTPPPSIADNCSTDVTEALDFWFGALPKGATANLPNNACYLVSNSNTSHLVIEHKWDLTVNGNGTTFMQIHYNPVNDPQNPILTLGANFLVAINNVTLRGPTSNGGWNEEGDSGIMMWQNFGVLLTGVTITNVEGDGMDIYPRGNQPGVNWYVTVNHSTIYNVGYKAMVPEAADHFTLENSTLVTSDIDAEVDFSCQGNLPDCGTLANPSIGVVNMTLKNNSFPNGLRLEDGMSCMPVGNWTIEDNNFGIGGLVGQFDTAYTLTLSALQACGRYSGLTIEGNTSTDTQQHPCCGSGSPYFLLQGWTNVTIANNHFIYKLSDGLIGGPVVELWGDSNVAITNNAFVNYYNLTLQDAPSGWPTTTGLTTCGNTTGSAQFPLVAAACK
jgi:hypothetical protein